MRSIRILLSGEAAGRLGDRLDAMAQAAGRTLRIQLAPARVPEAAVAGPPIDVAYFSRDIWQGSALAVSSEAALAFFATLQAASRLEWLHVLSSGADLPIYASIMGRCVLTTSQGVGALPIARTVLGWVLWRSRGFAQWQHAQARGEWTRAGHELPPEDLDGQTAVIVGMGKIGSEIARHLRFVGVHVVGVRRGRGDSPHFDASHRIEELDALLPTCDWLILACPLTPATAGLLDRRRLRLLPRNAAVVNVGRGGLVDEAALIEALAQRWIAGAYLDVFAREPLPPSSPLWPMPEVTISPHASSLSSGTPARVDALFLENFRRWLAGAELLNRVDPIAPMAGEVRRG